MKTSTLPWAAQNTLEKIGRADIVVGIPSYNNAHTIAHVVHAAQTGLAKYYSHLNCIIINSDGGSTDGTPQAVLDAAPHDPHVLLLETPIRPVHRLSFPYHGIPGKGSAFRMIFQIAQAAGAKACIVVDSDLRSITPEWIDLLCRPVMYSGYDFTAPYYHRHKYDGTITNSIVYPLTRALYGRRVRQPIGGDFGISGSLIDHYLKREDWETEVARFGVDIWMTTLALAGGFRVCQSFLGAKLHDAKDPSSDLSAMLSQVTSSVFQLMQEFESVWKPISGSKPVDMFGFRYDVGLEPIQVNVTRMLDAFRRGCADLHDVWALALEPDVLRAIRKLGEQTGHPNTFHLEDELWVRALFGLACAHRRNPVERAHLLASLTPLYFARVASFVIECDALLSHEVEDRIERLCLTVENLKPELIRLWDEESGPIQTPVPLESPVRSLPKEA